MFICFLRAVPRISSEYGAIHPPYAKPPLVSSSGPPGACMIPSRVICSSTITFLMIEFLHAVAIAPSPRADDGGRDSGLDQVPDAVVGEVPCLVRHADIPTIITTPAF